MKPPPLFSTLPRPAQVQLLVPGPRVFDQGLAGYGGRWIAENGLVITAVSVPHPHAQPE
jgi:hypothetical protein